MHGVALNAKAPGPTDRRPTLNDAPERPTPTPILLDDPQTARTHTRWTGLLASQVFWVVLATMVACVMLSFVTSTFATEQNLFNVTRNFAFVAIVALGMRSEEHTS